jgi:CHAD domain-containing protein
MILFLRGCFRTMGSEQLLSRKTLAQRWSCSTETIKRRTRDGLLHPLRFNARMIRYQLSEIIRIEREAGGQQ